MNTLWDDIFLATPDPDDGFQRNTGEYIEQYKAALQERIGIEHNFSPVEAPPQTNHGIHKIGSAMVYVSDVAPLYRPDGVTLLDISDKGRFWIDDAGMSLYWNGTDWIALSSASAPYTQVWSGSSNQITAFIATYGEGTYRATITDSLGDKYLMMFKAYTGQNCGDTKSFGGSDLLIMVYDGAGEYLGLLALGSTAGSTITLLERETTG